MKILFIPGGLGYGHVRRCLALADELKLLGVKEIAFGYGGPDNSIIEQEGYDIFRIHEITEEQILSKAGQTPNGAEGPKAIFELITDDNFIIKSVEDEVNAMEHYKPDLVVYEGRWTGNISAMLMKIPSISIIQNYLFLQPEIILKTVPNIGAANGLINLLNGFKDKVNEYRQQLGINKVDNIFGLFTSDLNYAVTIEGFGEIADENKNIIDYSGPFISKLKDGQEEPEWMRRLDPNKKTVYISTGGTRRAKAILKDAVEVLKELDDVQAVVSVGFGEFPYDVHPLPQRIILKPYVPGIMMTTKADVIVTHGGHSTIMELIKHKVPGLVIPFQPEQMSYAKVLEKSNAGRVLPSETFDKEKFRQYLTDLLWNEKYKSGINKLSNLVAGYPGSSGIAIKIMKHFSLDNKG